MCGIGLPWQSVVNTPCSTAGGAGLIPGQGTKIHMPCGMANKIR